MQEDIRWKQRFFNFNKAFESLRKYTQQTDLNELEKQGVIKAFEYNYELAWKTLQDLFKYEYGYTDIKGPKKVIRQALADKIINNGETWMEMINSRNITTHTYDKETANEIVFEIKNSYIVLFQELKIKLENI